MATSFKSNDTNVSDILRAISDGRNQLPDFQRGWVWDDNRIKSLIASISNSYPVGALMFLEYGGDNVRFKYRTFTGVSTETKPDVLVLDGQQRLTSIFTAMYCRDVVPTRTDKNQPIKRYYYLNVVECLKNETNREDAILSIPEDKVLRSDFGRQIDLNLETKEKEFENHMFPLNIVYDFGACSDWRNDYQRFYNHDKEILDRFTDFDRYVLRVIQDYKIPVITLDRVTPKEAVCQVFENVNTGGVSLTVFELMTATYAVDNFELRKDWEQRSTDFKSKSTLGGNDPANAVLSDVSATDFLTAVTLTADTKLRRQGAKLLAVNVRMFYG